MAKTLVFRNRSTAALSALTGTLAELFVDTTKKTVVVMDGATAGGSPLATEVYANARQTSAVVTANVYTDAQVAAVVLGGAQTATTTIYGISRPDGTSILIDAGTLSANVATSSVAGVVKPDGTSVLIEAGTISIQAFFTGMIMMWSGSVGSIPSGWALCDGTNGTPDLRNRMIMGAGDTYAVDATGGTSNSIVVSHTHNTYDKYISRVDMATSVAFSDPITIPYSTAGTYSSYITTGRDDGGNRGIRLEGTQDTTSTATTGSSGTNANLPPYYALAFIMKL